MPSVDIVTEIDSAGFRRAIRAKQDSQKGNNGQKGEEREDRTEGIEYNVPNEVQAIAQHQPEKVLEPPHAPVVPI